MGKLTRRALLGSVGAVVLGVVVYGGSRFACRFVPRNHPDFFALLDIAPRGPAGRRIGEAALANAQRPADFETFATSLQLRPLIAEAVASDCPTTRLTLVQDQCALDFAEGRTVTVDGWVLSETEANLCAARLLRPSIL